MRYETAIFKALDKVYAVAQQSGNFPIGKGHRYIIFSDQHKGAKNGADNFRPCEKNYLAALDYYARKDYSLVILGDAEEQQQERTGSILKAYREVMEREAGFYKKGKYHKIVGNHDYRWDSRSHVARFLFPLFPGIEVREGLVLEYCHPVTSETGCILLTHGHQGTIFSDKVLWLSTVGVWLFKFWRMLTGKGRNSPSNSYRLRAFHDRVMYTWASRKMNFALITGHTHRPVWSSVTHVQKLTRQLFEAKKAFIEHERLRPDSLTPRVADPQMSKRKWFLNKIIALRDNLADRMRRYPDEHDTMKTVPTYFNTGCCSFEDGDITGIELDGELIRLVKWGPDADNPGQFCKTVLEEDELANIFYDFDPKAFLIEPKAMIQNMLKADFAA
ncbi:MAG: hypothetical protein ACKVU2_16665 [Saprospiraceae bacterium]